MRSSSLLCNSSISINGLSFTMNQTGWNLTVILNFTSLKRRLFWVHWCWTSSFLHVGVGAWTHLSGWLRALEQENNQDGQHRIFPMPRPRSQKLEKTALNSVKCKRPRERPNQDDSFQARILFYSTAVLQYKVAQMKRRNRLTYQQIRTQQGAKPSA
jgi:hypothetical protein